MQPQSRVLSTKSPYYLPKNRQYELRYFCRQYNDWIKLIHYLEISPDGKSVITISKIFTPKSFEDKAVLIADLERNCSMVEKAAMDADPDISHYIFVAATKGYSFNKMKAVYNMPCEKDMFYDRCRRFYWILSQKRGV